MCGILGIYRIEINKEDEEEIKDMFRHLLILSQNRGSDATGVAKVKNEPNSTPEMVVAKSDMPSTEFVDSSKYKMFIKDISTSRTLIGHTRMMTQGHQKDNNNNHPIYSKETGFCVVHNGHINNYDVITEKDPDLSFDGKCDTEAILRLIEKYGVEEAVKKLYGSYSVALLDENEPDNLTLIRYSSPLYMAFVPKLNIILFSSDDDYIKNTLTSYGTLLNFFHKKWKTHKYYIEEVDTKSILTINVNSGGNIIEEHDNLDFASDDDYSYYVTSYNSRHNNGAFNKYNNHNHLNNQGKVQTPYEKRKALEDKRKKEEEYADNVMGIGPDVNNDYTPLDPDCRLCVNNSFCGLMDDCERCSQRPLCLIHVGSRANNHLIERLLLGEDTYMIDLPLSEKRKVSRKAKYIHKKLKKVLNQINSNREDFLLKSKLSDKVITDGEKPLVSNESLGLVEKKNESHIR